MHNKFTVQNVATCTSLQRDPKLKGKDTHKKVIVVTVKLNRQVARPNLTNKMEQDEERRSFGVFGRKGMIGLTGTCFQPFRAMVLSWL